jgi:uncharacterized membrane-anchored protein
MTTPLSKPEPPARTGLRLVLLFALQAVALAAMIADRQWTLNTGTPVVLETVPVDPRSLFMGDYARLSYRISRIRLDSVKVEGWPETKALPRTPAEPIVPGVPAPAATAFQRHETVWVGLQPEGPYWTARSLHRDRRQVPAGLVALRGEVEYFSTHDWDEESRKSVERPVVQLRYGIEQYFVPEGTGRAIERPAGGEKVSVRVAIDSRGKAGIAALLLDGRERYRETLF